MRLTIFIPCFNEKATILKAIQEAKDINIDKEIIVIDNFSTDGTREILQDIEKKKDPELKIVLHEKNYGVGYSVQEGIDLARGDYFYAPYADLEYKMTDVYNMFELLEKDNLEIVFGSRLKKIKNQSKLSLVRERPFWLGTIIATSLVNMLYRKRLSDVIATKLINTKLLKSFNFGFKNQAFEFELVSRLCKSGYSIGEVGISYSPRSRKHGKTIKAIDIIPAIFVIFKVRVFDNGK